MANKGQFTGMTGTYLVAAQLSARQLVSSPTSRSAAGADILVTDASCINTYSVQVKTNSKSAPFWILSRKEPGAGSRSYVYVFVNLSIDDVGDVTGDYYIVPSKVIPEIARYGGDRWPNYSVYREDVLRYRNNWKLFAQR